MGTPNDRGLTPGTVAILGATGRLGPAVVRAFGGWHTRGLSRRAPGEDETPPDDLVVGTRRDVDALRRVVDGADVVVDLLGFDDEDARALLAAVGASERPPGRLLFASSIAALMPDDDHGAGKRRVQAAYEEGFAGTVSTLILPRLVAAVDPGRRDQPYLDAAGGGRALHAGSGDQRQTMAPVDGVGEVARRLAGASAADVPRALFVGPPKPTRVRDAVRALLDGAGLDAPLARHPDRHWRGPHGGGDEVIDTRDLHRRFPDLVWPDPLAVFRDLGRWLAARAEDAPRPRPVMAVGRRRSEGRRLVDVHDRRPTLPMSDPIPALARLAEWMSPAFYVDVGRPCNAACVYCAVPPHADTKGFTPLAGLADQIRAGLDAGCRRAILVGGEPTIYPELDGLLDLLADAGLREHVVMTNGLRLARAGFVDHLVRRGVGTFHLSIDTADPEVHDRIARSHGQHGRQRAALDNLLRLPPPGVRLYVYCCVTGLNADGASDLVRWVAERARAADRPPPPVVFAFVKPVGDALLHSDALVVAPEQRARVAAEVVAAGEEVGITVGLRNLQACLAPSLAARDLDAYLQDYSVDISTGRREPYAHSSNWTHPEGCEGCTHRAGCSGVYVEDLARFGAAPWSAPGGA